MFLVDFFPLYESFRKNRFDNNDIQGKDPSGIDLIFLLNMNYILRWQYIVH